MSRAEMAEKIRAHLGVGKSCALMMCNAQSAVARMEFLKRMSTELNKAYALLDKLEKE